MCTRSLREEQAEERHVTGQRECLEADADGQPELVAVAQAVNALAETGHLRQYREDEDDHDAEQQQGQ